MNEIERRIRQKIEAFVVELNELVREAALDAVSEALGSTPKKAQKARATKRDKGQKRTQTEIDKTTRAAQSYVEKRPGEGVIAIAKALGVSTKDLQLPMKKLLGEGVLTTRGKKRATKYYPTK